jgi:peptidoglycan/LPS O-acetylase OafA/YrhL
MSEPVLPALPHRPAHFHAVDVLRGIAAIAVLIYHYKHFFYDPGIFEVSVPALADRFPLYAWLWPLYLFGNGAVQVFWMISGFVFAKVYAGKATQGSDFVVRRLARLYPLHFATLLIVAALQLAASALVGSNLIYQYNDPYHFALQLAFASNWGLERGFSFNGPIWSVSVEVLVYLLFWLVAEHLLKRGLLGPIALVAGAGVMLRLGLGEDLIWQCVQYFFIGCAMLHVAEHHDRPRRDLAMAVAAAALAGLAAIAFLPELRLNTLLMPLAIVLVGGAVLIDLGAAGPSFRRLRFIGDSTYGTYLWHVPLQIAALIVLNRLGIAAEARSSPVFFAAFLVVACTAGWLSYVAFEKPANRAILRWWASRRGATSAISA